MPNHLILKMRIVKSMNHFDQEATRDGIFLVDGVVHRRATIGR